MEKNNEKRVCVVCKKSLVKIGRARSNGKQTHDDWETRKCHKKCLPMYDFMTKFNLFK